MTRIMKKLLLLLSLGVFLFSCGSDDINRDATENGGILGYWEFNTVEPVDVVAKDAQSVKNIENYIRRYKGTDWEYLKNGKTIEYETYKGEVIEHNGKYSINGNLITRTSIYDTGEDGTPYTDRVEINGNLLIITVDDTKEVQMDYPNAGVTKAIVAFKYIRKK